MKPRTGDASAAEQTPAWDRRVVEALIDELWALRGAMLDHQSRLAPGLESIDPAQLPSAVNLVHYLAMRKIDLRRLQDRLARLGLSSLGRAETHVLANVDKVLGILHRLAGRPWTPLSQQEPNGIVRGEALLVQHAQTLFGERPQERDVRIMVTLPSVAATDSGVLIDSLVAAGMDIARINCAHDDAAAWMAMSTHVRRAAEQAGRTVRVLMDLGGPKLRTGPLASAPAVLRVKAPRDAWGRAVAPARLILRASGSAAALTEVVADVGPAVEVDDGWLESLQRGDRIQLTDTRGARREMVVVECHPRQVLVECKRSLYLDSDTRLRLRHQAPHGRHPMRESALGGIALPPGKLRLQRGDVLRLLPQGVGHAAVPAAEGHRGRSAAIACTLPEALAHVRKGERVWFDDGRIGGVVRRGGAKGLEIEITEARDGGDWLAADKGINFPDSRLDLPALSAKDIEDLAVVVRHADIVGLSFAQSAADVHTLRSHLAGLGASGLGVVLKIETRRGFERLPEMLLAAMAGPSAGVMIARGDLAVECGYERMAEVQEEILWACEAAHMPVIWATQVLETLARTGRPSRAEITDAAMGGRAECVMLNKGPHILDAMRTLGDILCRMQSHQSKKRPLLRALKSWSLPPSG